MHYVAVASSRTMPPATFNFQMGDNMDEVALENRIKNMYIDQFPNAESDHISILCCFKSTAQIDRAF